MYRCGKLYIIFKRIYITFAKQRTCSFILPMNMNAPIIPVVSPSAFPPAPINVNFENSNSRGLAFDEEFLKQVGYQIVCKVANSLQGFVYSARKLELPITVKSKSQKVIIKQTIKSLHHQKSSKIQPGIGKAHTVFEDIVKEANIMNILQFNFPKIGMFANSMVYRNLL